MPKIKRSQVGARPKRQLQSSLEEEKVSLPEESVSEDLPTEPIEPADRAEPAELVDREDSPDRSDTAEETADSTDREDPEESAEPGDREDTPQPEDSEEPTDPPLRAHRAEFADPDDRAESAELAHRAHRADPEETADPPLRAHRAEFVEPEPTPARGLPRRAEAVPTTEVQVHPAPPLDPRDATIRTLQLSLVIVGAIAVALLVALLVIVLRGTSAGVTTPPVSSETTGAPQTETPTEAPTPTYFTNYVPVNPDKVKEGALIVEIQTDYQCPFCQRIEDIYAEALYALSESGDVDLRIHVRTMVGDRMLMNDSSQRAAVAALCAQEVGSFWSYHSVIFANQPPEGVGYTDQQLRDQFPSDAGIAGAGLGQFRTCYDTQQTAQAVAAAEEEGWAAGIDGTPAIFVNGIRVYFNQQTQVPHGQPVQKITPEDLLAGLQSLQ